MKRKIFIVIALILAISVTSCVGGSPKYLEISDDNAKLIVHFIDVGQGDSTLLESRGEFVLIDAGEKEYGSTVVDYIRSRGAQSLKYIIATHPHTDHIGGMSKVINSISAGSFITVETDQNTRAWLDTLKAVEDNGLDYIDAEPGDTYSFGEAEFTILAPLGGGYSGYNDYSVVTKVTCGSRSFLLTGDAEKQSEKEMLSSGADLSADVLKCGHHGSSTSSTANFLKAVRPAYAVISCGKDNDYGHPHKETLKKLSLLGCACYRTDESGTIVAVTDGESLSFTASAGELPEPPAGSSGDITYIGNKNSKVFHLPDCSGARNMSEKNKISLPSREYAIEQGYTPCSLCEP